MSYEVNCNIRRLSPQLLPNQSCVGLFATHSIRHEDLFSAAPSRQILKVCGTMKLIPIYLHFYCIFLTHQTVTLQ
jgi:hypothetical protein